MVTYQVARRVNVALVTVAGIVKVPHMHRVVTAIAIETGISVEHSRTNYVVKVGPVSCRAVVEREAVAIAIRMTFFMISSYEIPAGARLEKYVLMLPPNVRFAS